MGQRSSQTLTPMTEQPNVEMGAELDTVGKRQKSRKRRREVLEDKAGQDQSTITSLPLRENTVHGGEHEDDLAASAQLVLESSPHRSTAPHDVGNNVSGQSESGKHYERADGSRRKKRKRLHSKSLGKGDLFVSKSVDEPPKKKSRKSQHKSSSTDRLNYNKSTLSIDDIDSEDEDVATFLQEYENDATSRAKASSTEAIESASQMQQLAATVDKKKTVTSVKHPEESPFNGGNPPRRREKRQKKGNALSVIDPYPNTDSVDDLELFKGANQATLDHVEPDDSSISQPDSSEALNQISDKDSSLEGEVLENAVSPAPSVDDIVFDHEDTPSQEQALLGNVRRVYSSAGKKNPVVEPVEKSLQDLVEGESYEFEINHQDRALPGIEDVRGHPSPCRESLSETSIRQPETWESHSRASNRQSEASDGRSGTSGRNSGSSNPQSEVENEPSEYPSPYGSQLEKTPPPLLKPSKPRGNKRQQGGKKSKDYNPSLKHISEHGGMFTKSEVAKLDKVRDSYCHEQNITHRQFNELIHMPVRGNGQARGLWDSLHSVLAYRTRMSISRFCRRHYHNYSARGTWTQSEDESLRLAVEAKGNSWKAVGEMIGRFPEDCRDRYRNYHGKAKNRNREHWTDTEVRNLCMAVYECMAAVKIERRKAKEEKYAGRDVPESEVESDPEVIETKLIHWASVSDRMGSSGGGRSRLQCAHKWMKLKTAERRNYWKEVRAVLQNKKPSKNGMALTSTGWRMKRSLRKLKNMRTGDRYDFLQAFSTCNALEPGNVPWGSLGDEEFRARWDISDRKAAWTIFRNEVPDAENMEFREIINRLLTRLMAHDMFMLDDRWDPAIHGDVSRQRKDLRKERKAQRERHRQENPVVVRGRIKSKDYVRSSDDEDGGDIEGNNIPNGEPNVSATGSGELNDSEVDRQDPDSAQPSIESADDDHEDEEALSGASYRNSSDELISQLQQYSNT